MSTTVTSIIERVSDILDNYGDASTTLTAAVTDTTSATFTVAAGTGVGAANDWLVVDGEQCEITAAGTTSFTVRRGMRGSVAATHLNGAVVRVNTKFPPHRILNGLNAALEAAYPELSDVVSDVTLTVVASTYDYTKPTAVDDIRQFWVETSTSGQYEISRNFELVNDTTIHLWGSYATGKVIKCVGTKRFAVLTYAGNLDAAFPDTNHAALNYLVYFAAADLLYGQQGVLAKRDSFTGLTDPFSQSAPALSVAVADRYYQVALRYLRDATRKIQLPEEILPLAGRHYLGRG